jgi:putative tricarboxylic transport membrane protein
MFDLGNIVIAIQNAFTLVNIGFLFFGSLIGVIVGIIPGIGPMVGMVILLPFTFSIPTDQALSLLLGIFCGGYFGGAVPAVLIKSPGEPSSIWTAFDGYPMTQRGEAQTALSASLLGSLGGGVVSVVVLIFLAPALAHVAASFGSPEYFSASVFGATMLVMAYRKHLAASVLLLGLGMWLNCVGVDPGTMITRYDFGTLSLRNGFHIAPVCLGIYGIAQMLIIAERPILLTDSINLSRHTLDFSKLLIPLRHWKILIRASLVGTFVGLLPGPGSITASFMSYESAKWGSKHREKFGTGLVEGVMAAEAGDSAVPAGAMIPLLTLGIPGEAVSAVLLGILSVQGIYPGPLLLIKEPVLINEIYVSLFLIQISAFLMLALGLRSLAMIVKIPSTILSPTVVVIAFVGIYSLHLRFFDVGVALAFAVFGYILERLDWPAVSLIIGLVLGEIMEERLRESLSMSAGDPMIFIERPISLIILIVTALVIIVPLTMDYRRRKRLGLNKN